MVNHAALDKAISKKRCTNVVSERAQPEREVSGTESYGSVDG